MNRRQFLSATAAAAALARAGVASGAETATKKPTPVSDGIPPSRRRLLQLNGYAANAEEVAPLAAAGADFVALGEWVFAQSAGQSGPVATIAGAARCLAEAEVAA